MMFDAERRIEEWHDRKYDKVTLAATYRKLLEEVGELGERLIEKDFPGAYEEAADSLAVLTHLVRSLGGELEDALSFAASKVELREAAEAAGKE